MYGPEATTFSLYVDGDSLSNFSAYSFGTGVRDRHHEERGEARALRPW